MRRLSLEEKKNDALSDGNDLQAADIGNGFLMRRGYTILLAYCIPQQSLAVAA